MPSARISGEMPAPLSEVVTLSSWRDAANSGETTLRYAMTVPPTSARMPMPRTESWRFMNVCLGCCSLDMRCAQCGLDLMADGPQSQQVISPDGQWAEHSRGATGNSRDFPGMTVQRGRQRNSG